MRTEGVGHQAPPHTIFQDVPSEIEETWRHGALLGGMAEGSVTAAVLASSFKRAGDVLLKVALESGSADDFAYPVLFNYRHSIELYLKAVVQPGNLNHGLRALVSQFKDFVRKTFNEEVPASLIRALLEFDDFDPRSTAFRYPEVGIRSRSNKEGAEVWVDFRALESTMDRVERAFRCVLGALRKASHGTGGR
jgi:hypothetical protein